MKISEVRKLSPTERFLYWIRERESIRIKKGLGITKPWTDDEILQRYRFCNVRRMDDKVSDWLLKNWYRPYFNHKNMLLACCLARHLNEPASLAAIGFPRKWQPSRIISVVRGLRSNGVRVFNPAYRILGKGDADAIASVVNVTLQPIVDNPPTIVPDSLEESWSALGGYYGLGSFMAGQVVADLRWAMLGSWGDRNKWAPMGPGSMRGLNRIYQAPIETKISQRDFLVGLLAIVSICKEELPVEICSRLEAHDYQNCLCEYDKFVRALEGGRPKQLYSGV